MSGYILIVYGAVLPLPATASIADVADECFDEGTGPLKCPYSGNGDAPYWAGVEIATLRQYAWPKNGYEVHTLEPTDAQKREAEAIVSALPEALRLLMTPVGRYIIPCP